MQHSNKYKPYKRCGCKVCRRASDYKTFELRRSRRVARHSVNNELKRALELNIEATIANLDRVTLPIAGADYTD